MAMLECRHKLNSQILQRHDIESAHSVLAGTGSSLSKSVENGWMCLLIKRVPNKARPDARLLVIAGLVIPQPAVNRSEDRKESRLDFDVIRCIVPKRAMCHDCTTYEIQGHYIIIRGSTGRV